MKNSKVKFDLAEVNALVGLFQTSPEDAFHQLIASGVYFNHPKCFLFWDSISKLDFDEVKRRFPQSEKVFHDLDHLKRFYHLNSVFKQHLSDFQKEIISRNPSKEALLKALFLCLELKEANPNTTKFPGYSEESLEAIKRLLKEVTPGLSSENSSGYSPELANLCNQAIRTEIDLILLEDFLDAFVWAGFCVIERPAKMGFRLHLSDSVDRSSNLFILNYLKKEVKRNYKKIESQPHLSEEAHLKKHDPKWKTNEGLVTCLVGGGVTVTSTQPGTTYMQVNDSFFYAGSKDGHDSFLNTMALVLEQSFHYQFRQAMALIYQPNDEVDIHALQVEIKPKVFVSIFELICAMSCLIAKADNFRYLSDFYCGSISSIWRDNIGKLHVSKPELTLTDLASELDEAFIHGLPQIEERYQHSLVPHIVNLETIVGWFRKVEELKNKKDSELRAIVDLFSSLESGLPFNPIYESGNQYYFSFLTCSRFNLNRHLYDFFISDKLFNSGRKTKEELLRVDKSQKSRELKFTSSIADILKILTPFVAVGLKFGEPNSEFDFGDLEGDCDVLAYFEKENLLLAIQVKLSNVSPRTERRKAEWIQNHIEKKGVSQVVKDQKLLAIREGLAFVSRELQIPFPDEKPQVYSLVVTDNFFCDHQSFQYNDEGDKVYCISYFELKSLIRGQKVHEKQVDWEPFDELHGGNHLIRLIEENLFWSFLKEYADDFKYSMSLMTVDAENGMELTI